MHLLQLHRSSMFGGKAPHRRGAPPARHKQLFSKSDSIKKKAPPPARHRHLFSKSDSIKKRSAGAATKGSKRARLRAGFAAALQELRLAARRHERGSSPMPAARTTRPGEPQVGLQVPACRAAAESGSPKAKGTAATAGSGALLLLLVLVLLALLCVVALGRAPAVCCCTTCAAWWCRGTSAAAAGRHQAPPRERRALQVA
ncbi:unnamed protein product [Urochloa humidicola]